MHTYIQYLKIQNINEGKDHLDEPNKIEDLVQKIFRENGDV